MLDGKVFGRKNVPVVKLIEFFNKCIRKLGWFSVKIMITIKHKNIPAFRTVSDHRNE